MDLETAESGSRRREAVLEPDLEAEREFDLARDPCVSKSRKRGSLVGVLAGSDSEGYVNPRDEVVTALCRS